jgi:hypothetical protein
MLEPNPTEQRDRAIELLQKAFSHPDGPARVRALQTRLKIKKFNEIPDARCAELLAESEALLADLKDQSDLQTDEFDGPREFDQVAALTAYAEAVDRVRQRTPANEEVLARLDWAMERARINPWRLEGSRQDDMDTEAADIAGDDEMFANYTIKELRAWERRLAKIVNFEAAKHDDFLGLEADLLTEIEALLFDRSLKPLLRRLLRVLAGAPFNFRLEMAMRCHPRAQELDCADLAPAATAILGREFPAEEDADDDSDSVGETGSAVRH